MEEGGRFGVCGAGVGIQACSAAGVGVQSEAGGNLCGMQPGGL